MDTHQEPLVFQTLVNSNKTELEDDMDLLENQGWESEGDVWMDCDCFCAVLVMPDNAWPKFPSPSAPAEEVMVLFFCIS